MADKEIHELNGAGPRVTVSLARALLTLFPEAPVEVTLEGATVGDVVEALEARWPGMRDRICDTTPAIRRHINVFVDGRRARLDTPLRDGIKVYVLTAISGG
jgi:molybdopterin synthase sulfur carrier subunit